MNDIPPVLGDGTLIVQQPLAPVPYEYPGLLAPVPLQHADQSGLLARLREALADARLTNRALEIEAERLRQRVRALEAAIVPADLAPGREASLLLQIADLTETVGQWQGKYGRLVRERGQS